MPAEHCECYEDIEVLIVNESIEKTEAHHKSRVFRARSVP